MLKEAAPINLSLNKKRAIYFITHTCGEEKQTLLNETYYSQSMGKGRIIGEDTPNEILYPKPKEVRYIVMKFVCIYVK